MKFFFDARYIRTDFHDGISRYSAELGRAIATRMPTTFLICDDAQKKFLPDNAETLLIHAPTSTKEPFTSIILNAYQPDVVFSPMQTMGSFGRRFKLMLTIHDLIYYRHSLPPRNLPVFVRIGWRIYHLTYIPQRAILNRADAVATVSRTSHDDIAAARLTRHDVTLIPNAPQNLGRFLQKTPRISKTTPKNLVYMGSFMPYKNVETLIRGMALLPGYTLHLLSRISPKRKAQLQALISPEAKVIFHGGVSDETYAALLADNAVLVSASLDEGYGIPLAEALELGVPAVVSDLAIFREVAGEGALYFPPTDHEAFAKRVLETAKLSTRSALVKAGTAHIAQYSWESSAEALERAVRSLSGTID